MKQILTNAVLAAVAAYGVAGDALANFCGFGDYPACDVPEPSSAYLFVGAAAVAALVVKLRKKK